MTFDLGAYLGRFDEVCRRKFRRTTNSAGCKKILPICAGKTSGWRPAISSHIRKLFHRENTPFEGYWPHPDFEGLDVALRKRRVRLAPLPDDPRDLIQTLLSIFHNIGTASLVLRFTYPERFGIFSTPVINLLQVQRPRSVELYLAYCRELQEWRNHFRLQSVAETEMALWTSSTGF